MSENFPTTIEIAQMFNELETAETDLIDARKEFSDARNRVADLVNTINELRSGIQRAIRQRKIDQEARLES